MSTNRVSLAVKRRLRGFLSTLERVFLSGFGVRHLKRVKRFTGESYLLIGSRFHALVSALSQGVPTLATGWSHKYEMLFEDYGVSEFRITVDIKRKRLAEKLNQLNRDGRTRIVGIIRDRGLTLEQQAESIWREMQHIVLR